ncbi:TetR/AcrR family transcriptional regulator [Nocardioides mangrovicus]|uniref:TetR/AcrR family transcriptional regulator n=1 Tax=Nocardioides mangrovicus TaxID=2478913 RepID=A0A3L8P376_9ACTN|nr:TetR/AcrR family transcriptional regulator [Nocardioides mangrovicus]RLV49800.1 TetR/AcrR family transcriptional regulator [Nocardioides mangrovicus]
MTPPAKDGTDGRAARWEEHRENRRVELVESAVAAIDEYGPEASVSEIAKAAGVSRPVLYRYFADKDDLYAAVGMWGATTLLEMLVPALLSDGPIHDRVAQGVETYLDLIDTHPHLFTLLVGHASSGDPLADGKAMIAAAIARTLGDALRDLGVDAGGAEPWAHGLVGLGLSVGTWWLERRTMSKKAVTTYLTGFVWHAFEGIAADYGVGLDDRGRLVVVG